MHSLLISLTSIALCFLFACASATKTKGEGDELYDKYLQLTKMQAAKDPLIGIWQGSKGGQPVILAVVENNEDGPERLQAVILNGSEFQFGYSDGDPWFYVSPMAAQGTYAGKIVYKYLFWPQWNPTKIVMSNYNSFTTYDDVPAHVKAPGGKVNAYMRKEQVITVDDIARSSGSGFLVRNTNLIITAHHVVGKAKTIGVRFPDGNIYPAEIVGRDAQNDIAILRLEYFTPSAERGFQLDHTSEVAPGETVHALGYPLGEMLGKQPSIVSGQVSSTVGIKEAPNQFSITAPINPGNSGGPILNSHGTVVGVAVAVIRHQQIEGVAFGIKIEAALPMLKKLAVDLKENECTAMSADEIFRRFSQDVVYIKIK